MIGPCQQSPCATESPSARTTSDLNTEAAKLGARHSRCFHAHSASFTIEQRRVLLNNVSLSARPGTLTATIGPSGAGKSRLAKLIGGTAPPTMGADRCIASPKAGPIRPTASMLVGRVLAA
jgi:ABC-type multidrug transport system fused ATPase/permease subunit